MISPTTLRNKYRDSYNINEKLPESLSKIKPRKEKPSMLPGETDLFYQELKTHNYPDNGRRLFFFILFSVIFLFLGFNFYQNNIFILHILSILFFVSGIICIIGSIYGFISWLKNFLNSFKADSPVNQTFPQEEVKQEQEDNIDIYYNFAEDKNKNRFNNLDSLDFKIPDKQLFRSFLLSDRVSHQIQTRTISISTREFLTDSEIDKLALESLKELQIVPSVFNKYVNNMKKFIQQIFLTKLHRELHSGSQLTNQMLSIPRFDNERDYIMKRIEILSKSHLLKDHQGTKGERWKNREWNPEFPSDNQIILHTFSVWLSFYINGKKPGSNLFKEMFFSVEKAYDDPHAKLSKEKKILKICTEDNCNFYIKQQKKNQDKKVYWVPPGKDSLYNAFTLFFYKINVDHHFKLDNVDLEQQPFLMYKIFN